MAFATVATVLLSYPAIAFEANPPVSLKMPDHSVSSHRMTEDTVKGYIALYSAPYGLSEEVQAQILDTLRCESKFNPSAKGDYSTSTQRYTSFGIAQIHLPAHPSISQDLALDPAFSISWTVAQFADNKQNMWSCYKKIT